MRHNVEDRLCNGAGRIAHNSEHLFSNSEVNALLPIRAQLGGQDYWLLNEHRRRFETIGTMPSLRLARLIRVKLGEARFVDDSNIGSDIVTGTSRVSFVIDAGRPQTRRLYHWAYPEHDRNRLAVGTFLGVTLIGMHVGHQMRFIRDDGMPVGVMVLGVDG